MSSHGFTSVFADRLGRPVIHLIARWPWANALRRLWNTVMPTATSPPSMA